jgi:hypothetical protein
LAGQYDHDRQHDVAMSVANGLYSNSPGFGLNGR